MSKTYARTRLWFLSTLMGMGGLILTQPVFAAGSGYTSPTPTPSAVPGGFTQVLTSQTMTASPGTISVSGMGSSASFSVPTGTFSAPTTVSVTAPNLSAITSSLPSLGLGSYQALAGFGISFTNAVGSAVTPLAPITATIRNPAIAPGDILVKLTGPTSSVTIPAHFSAGQVTFQFQQDPDFAVLKPSSTVTGATSPTTGVPVDTWAGAGLALAGAGVWLLRRAKQAGS